MFKQTWLPPPPPPPLPPPPPPPPSKRYLIIAGVPLVKTIGKLVENGPIFTGCQTWSPQCQSSFDWHLRPLHIIIDITCYFTYLFVYLFYLKKKKIVVGKLQETVVAASVAVAAVVVASRSSGPALSFRRYRMRRQSYNNFDLSAAFKNKLHAQNYFFQT